MLCMMGSSFVVKIVGGEQTSEVITYLIQKAVSYKSYRQVRVLIRCYGKKRFLPDLISKVGIFWFEKNLVSLKRGD